jgi:aryl-alcohol dehydrogenase-like predicted oxidoreductase
MMEDYFTQPVLDAVQRLKPLAEQAHCTLAQLALAWCLRDEVVSAVIVGATRPEQVDDNVAAADLDVDPEIFHQMNHVLAPVAPYEPYTS